MKFLHTPCLTGAVLAAILFLLVFSSGAGAAVPTVAVAREPGVYLNFNEGSGTNAFDLSGHGASGSLYGPSRTDNAGCGQAIVFNGIDNYASIPYTSANHPTDEITVSTWFYTDSFDPQVLVSSYNGGGYRLAFGDGEDLWWTVNLQGPGEVSVPVQHESITPHQWHYITGVYDGQMSRVYLDGILRNQVNATGPIHYEYNNYVFLGAEAGTYDKPSPVCPHFFRGGLDEVRIYPSALTTGEIIDDRLLCTPGEILTPPVKSFTTNAAAACIYNSGTLRLGPGESVVRTLTFANASETGTWNIGVPPGSLLEVQVRDRYSASYPDTWYAEMGDEHGRIDRIVAFPSTNSRPVNGVIPSGNATATIRYFDGKGRFPATVDVLFSSSTPPPPAIPAISTKTILSNPIIVIYSASWATLIAILLVVIWLHRRNKAQK